MRTRRRKRNKRRRWEGLLLLFVLVVAAVLLVRGLGTDGIQKEVKSDEGVMILDHETFAEANDIIEAFAKENDLSMSEWPQELIELLERNPETEEFVLNYPLKKDLNPAINLDEYKDCNTVPLLMQWDERWGYYEYGDDVMGISGCGPTCLSMVCMYLLGNTNYNPKYIAEFSEANGYCVPGNGSAWTLISEGGKELGLDVEELPLDEDNIIRNLEAGNPIICVMGPGDFTTTGHFIVMTGCVDGKIKVNDPNSKIRSEKLWNYEDIENQIRNLWVCFIKL